MTISPTTSLNELQSQERTIEGLFERAVPSVAYISTFAERVDRMTMNPVEIPVGTGSGIVWDANGRVLTNYHVIKGARSAKVALTDNAGRSSQYDARLVGVDPDKDIAVLQIDAGGRKLTPIELGSSRSLRVGQVALAIGNPFGLDHTLTVGVVSGLDREMISPTGRPITGVIQTDASINPGNSGGALLDSSGRLIGMNTQILSASGSSAGIGFAVPVDTLAAQVGTIVANGKVARPALGIAYAPSGQARSLGVGRGVLVLDVPPRSPAEKAGLRGTYRVPSGEVVLGDVITAANGAPVEREVDLFRALDACRPGQRVAVQVERLSRGADGRLASRSLELTVELQAVDPAA